MPEPSRFHTAILPHPTRKASAAYAEAPSLAFTALLLRCFGLGRIRLRELAPEAVYATRGVDQLLFAREERVARRADFQHDVALMGGARLEVRAASALDSNFLVMRMDLFLRHFVFLVGPGRLAVRLQTGEFTVTSKGLTRYRLDLRERAFGANSLSSF